MAVRVKRNLLNIKNPNTGEWEGIPAIMVSDTSGASVQSENTEHARTADSLLLDKAVGGKNEPVYFNEDGKPVSCGVKLGTAAGYNVSDDPNETSNSVMTNVAMKTLIDETIPSMIQKGSPILKDFPDSVYLHNVLPRGKDIQTYFDNGELYKRIANGTFEDLYIGDYFKVNYDGARVTFRLAGFNPFYNKGGAPGNRLTRPHAVIIPDSCLGTDHMTSDSMSNGYAGSNVHATKIGGIASAAGAGNINQKLYGIFGNHLLTTKEYLTTGVIENSLSSAGAGFYGSSSAECEWEDCQAVLMSEVEIYGANIFSSSGFDTLNANVQLPLFRLMPNMIASSDNNWFWLRNLSGERSMCICGAGGYSYSEAATDEHGGIRPRITIG